VSYSLVVQLQQKVIPFRQVCQVLGISRSGYYEAQQRQARVASVCVTSVHMKAAFHASGGCYGSRRLHAEGLPTGRYKVRRLMRLHGLRPIWKRKFVRTIDSKHALPVAENILNRQFEPAAPNRAWVADITYIRTRAGWLYLAAVLDLYSRKIVGWAWRPACRPRGCAPRCRLPLHNASPQQD